MFLSRMEEVAERRHWVCNNFVPYTQSNEANRASVCLPLNTCCSKSIGPELLFLFCKQHLPKSSSFCGSSNFQKSSFNSFQFFVQCSANLRFFRGLYSISLHFLCIDFFPTKNGDYLTSPLTSHAP